MRAAAAGYWERRGLGADPDLVVAGPGSKALLFALLLAIGGDVVLPVPGWVSYAAQARLAGAVPLPVPIVPGQGGVPDPWLLRETVTAARAAGRDPRIVIATVPDNPTGTLASPAAVREFAWTARDLELTIVSDEIYGDLVYDTSRPAPSPAHYAPEITAVTTGLTKNLALGGWRTGVALLPGGPAGRALASRLISVASQIWSSPPAPVQAAAAYAFGEPPELLAHVAASRRLHEAVARAAAERFRAVGALLEPVRATCYLYPDFEPLREQLAAVHGVHTGDELARWFGERHGVGVLPASAFGQSPETLRIRAATSRLYGETEAEQWAALAGPDPQRLPWIARRLDWIGAALADLAGNAPAQP